MKCSPFNVSVPVVLRSGLAALSLLVLCPSVGVAQQEFQMKSATTLGYSLQGDSTPLDVGLNSWEFLFRADGKRYSVSGLQLDLKTMNASLSLGLPQSGFWGQQSFTEFSRELKQPLIALGTAPRFLEQDTTEQGFLFFESRIYQWPPKHAVLCLGPSGLPSLVKPQEFTSGQIRLSSGAVVPLEKLNSRPEGDRVVLLSGRINLRPEVTSWWPPQAMACALVADQPTAGQNGEAIHHAALWGRGDTAGSATFTPLRVRPLNELVLGDQEYALIYLPEKNAELHQELLTWAPVKVFIPLPKDVQFSQLSFQLGDTLLENGTLVAAERGTAPRGVVCLRQDSAELMILDLGPELERLPWNTFVEHARQQNFSEVYTLSDTAKPFTFSDDSQGLSTAGDARSVLYPKVKEKRLTVAGQTNVQRLRVTLAQGNNDSQTQGTALALFDGSYRPERPLVNYWSAPVEKPRKGATGTLSLPWVEVRLEQPARLQLIDLHHAESVGFSPRYDLKAFRLLARSNGATPWVELLKVENAEPQAQQRLFIENTGPWEYLRLEVLEPAFQRDAVSARLAEMILWGVPVDSTPRSSGDTSRAVKPKG